MRRLFVFGAGGHAVCVADAALASGWQVTGFVDEYEATGRRLGIPVFPSLPRDHVESRGHVVIGVGDNADRQSIAVRLSGEYPRIRWATVIDPRAQVSAFAEVGAGAVVLAGAIIGPRSTLSPGTLINMGAVVTHDCSLAAYSSVGPSAALGGGVGIGERTAIGASAAVREKANIGSDAVIGAASLVLTDVPDGVIVFGVPARVEQPRVRGDRYLR